MASPQLKEVIAQYKALGAETAKAQGPGDVRTALSKAFRAFPSKSKVKVEPVSAGGVPAEWISAPDASADKAVLYLHGGGYGAGGSDTHRELAARISEASGARTLLIDYRLAPENPFPAAIDDAVAAYRFILASGVAPSKVAIGGDSAGGGLTLALLLALRDAKIPLPAAGVCISPWADLEAIGETMATKAEVDPVVGREFIVLLGNMYVGEKGNKRAPLAAPIYGDMRGLPPLLIQVGSAETLLSDATRVAERAGLADVEATLQIWPDMPHVWHWFAPILPEGDQAIKHIGEFVRRRFA
jgi:phosphinothricin tripeptide acetyl hydrolase